MSRAGKKAFDRCDVKVVEFKTLSFLEGSSGGAVLTQNLPDAKKDYTHAGYFAVLQCPRTEDDRTRVTSEYATGKNKPRALKEVRQLAGELLCRNCRFSTMTPVEVSVERKELADAEAQRVESYKLLEAARAEVEAVENPQLPEAGQ